MIWVMVIPFASLKEYVITKSEALCNRSYFITSIHQESKILDVI